jgi:hypothetical protein
MTLDISIKRFDNIAKNKTVSGVSPKDKRGKHEPANKISQSKFQFVKAHISPSPSIPATIHGTKTQTGSTVVVL